MCRLSWNLGASTSWNPQGLSRAVMGLLYLLPFAFRQQVSANRSLSGHHDIKFKTGLHGLEMVLSQISWIIKYFCVWLKTNVFIIVFQFYNTTRCPLQQQQKILRSLYIQELRKVLCNFLFLWPVYNPELLFCLSPITGYFLSVHLSHKMQPTHCLTYIHVIRDGLLPAVFTAI